MIEILVIGVVLTLLVLSVAPLVAAAFLVLRAVESQFRFRLLHLCYAITLLAGALATMGGRGIVIAAVLLIAWAGIASSRSRNATWWYALAGVLPALMLGTLLTLVPQAREAAHRMQCAGRLKQLGAALHNYHHSYGQFPPAFIADETGKPMHSWRVLILPFIEQQTLYAQYDFNEPWDGPNNRRLLSHMPSTYRCPSFGSPDDVRTSYVAVVGDRSAWPVPHGRKWSEFPDGTSQTLLVVEAPDQQPLWMEPKDLALEEAVQLFAACYPGRRGGHRDEGFFRDRSAGWQCVAADGIVHYASHAATPSTWRAAMQVDDATDSPIDRFGLASHAAGTPRWGNLFRLVLFLLIILLPLPWWLHARQKRSALEADGT